MKECKNVEFKESWRDEYFKTIAAFANSSGGEVLIRKKM
jgi:predicted HTH transcriptional regulator